METEVGKQKLVRMRIKDLNFFSTSIKGDFLWNGSVKHSAPFIVISMAMTTFPLGKAGQKTSMTRYVQEFFDLVSPKQCLKT